MSEATKTIAFRVSQPIQGQINDIAKANGQSKSEWVRDQVMHALHAALPQSPEADQPSEPTRSSTGLLEAIEARIQQAENGLRDEICAVRTAVTDAANSHHRDLCTMAQVGLEVEESMEQRIEASCVEVLDAVERLKQSQRSHKDTLLRAIPQSSRPTPGRY